MELIRGRVGIVPAWWHGCAPYGILATSGQPIGAGNRPPGTGQPPSGSLPIFPALSHSTGHARLGRHLVQVLVSGQWIGTAQHGQLQSLGQQLSSTSERLDTGEQHGRRTCCRRTADQCVDPPIGVVSCQHHNKQLPRHRRRVTGDVHEHAGPSQRGTGFLSTTQHDDIAPTR